MKPLPPLRILVADDHWVVREGLRGIILSEPDLVVAGEAVDGVQAVEFYDRLLPDVTLMDLGMPLRGGVEAIRLIRRKHPEARILVLSTFDGDENIHEALQAGAMGYLLKNGPGDQIAPAIRALVAGQKWIPAEVGELLARRNHTEVLTPREREILFLMASGEANKQIADAIGIAENTAKSHVKNILGKLQVRDRTEAVTLALRRGLVRMPDIGGASGPPGRLRVPGK